MAISLAISITRFHSQSVDVVKSGEEVGGRGQGGLVWMEGRSNFRSVNCKCLVIGIFKTVSEEKIT